jgi:hypothetical protein
VLCQRALCTSLAELLHVSRRTIHIYSANRRPRCQPRPDISLRTTSVQFS